MAHAGKQNKKKTSSVRRVCSAGRFLKAAGEAGERRSPPGGRSGVCARRRSEELWSGDTDENRSVEGNLDMAGVKTVDLLLGVVLVLQCVGNARAEITASNGKKLFYYY